MKVDMHLHTSKSDGRDSVHNMIEAAEKKGLDLVAITDHGPGHGSGITERQARETKKEVALLQPSYRVRVLVGIEAEILSTGEVLLADREGMDIVLASYHAAPSEETYYRAVFRAMEDPRVDVLAHHAWSAGMQFGLDPGARGASCRDTARQRQGHRDQLQALPADLGFPGHVPGCGREIHHRQRRAQGCRCRLGRLGEQHGTAYF